MFVPKRFDLIIFDWDGTLVNTIDWIVHCLQNAAVRCRFEVPEDQVAKDVIGLSIDNAVRQLFPEADNDARNTFIEHYGQAFFAKQLSRADLFKGVFDMLNILRASGYRLAVATGKGRKGLQKALVQTGTEHLFDITRCADETASKPAPVMLQEIIDRLEIPTERALMVGDSIHDLQMARNAGIVSAAVACGAHSPELLRQYDPLFNLAQTSQLLEFI
ncbi:HAD-IA family hydrolase [Methylotuvimicrobium sp. KM2]|uniref:HAD-IA family hydrolase n=1 Tax=Methylotuvimicrobium sp. KM2 TaxID=3133976 RepID=UPI003101607C